MLRKCGGSVVCGMCLVCKCGVWVLCQDCDCAVPISGLVWCLYHACVVLELRFFCFFVGVRVVIVRCSVNVFCVL